MSKCCLGDTFDIHGGGPDLPFPHHENEIAQSEAANGCAYANYWMHAGPVRVNSEKMSKSLGNFFTIRDVLEKYDAEVVRFFLARVHYRSYIDYSEDSLKEARVMLERFYQSLNGVVGCEFSKEDAADVGINGFEQRFIDAMDDDFNTPKAISVLFEMVNELNKLKKTSAVSAATMAHKIVELGGVLGLLQQNPDAFLKGEDKEGELGADDIEALIQQRVTAKTNKDYAESDRIRDELAAQGIVLKDSREGTTWFRES
jgi:cysteinyl-tRNA synthetase